MNNKDLWLSLFRTALTAFGSFLFGKNILGASIDSVLWQEIVGIIIAVGSTVWGILDKSATVDGIQSAVRSVAVFIGGLLVASGKLSSGALDSWMGFITTLVTVILSATSRSKAQQLAKGEIKISTKPDGKTAELVDVKPPQT